MIEPIKNKKIISEEYFIRVKITSDTKTMASIKFSY